MSPRPSRAEAIGHETDDVGPRLREERTRKDMSLRELARRVGISASALSQIETGRSRPSVSTLYSIVSELGVSLDELFGDAARDGKGEASGPAAGLARIESPVQPAGSRSTIELESGVVWERLTPSYEHDADFLDVTYPVGSSSSPEGISIRHSGREYGLVLEGRLKVTIAFDSYELGPGDSIVFNSTEPHRLENIGDVPVRAVWFVHGRRSDNRAPRHDERPAT